MPYGVLSRAGVFLLLFLLGACAGRQGGDELSITSYDGVSEQYPNASADLAAKAAFTLTERYPVGTTVLYLVRDTGPGSFGLELESGLRTQGFSLESAPTPESIRLGYTLDMIRDESKPSCYLQIKTSDGGSFGESYALNAAGEPAPSGTLAQSQPFFSLAPQAAPATPGMGGVAAAATQGMPAAEEWLIAPGSLKTQLGEWTQKAGYQLIWKAEHDYTMQTRALFKDSFMGAIRRVFTRMHLNGNALRATIYEDNRVVEVTED